MAFHLHEYEPNSDYVLITPNSDLVLTALTGVPPPKEENRIYFYSTWLIIPEKGNDGFDKLLNYNVKDILKVKSLTAKKSHFHLFTGIDKIMEPLFHHGWEEMGYVALLGRRRDGELKGYLLWIGEHPYVMGIWPIENRKRYEETDEGELQSLLESEINDFRNPKLWKGVYMINHASKK